MTKTLIIIGQTGSGKSTLANVLVNKNDNFEEVFEESGSSSSVTKEIKSKEFEIDNDKYLVIDTVGIGDTKLKQNEVLDKIAEAVYLAREGVSQILFVTRNRFDQFQMSIYDLLKTIIFDEHIANHTTIVRTEFTNYYDEKKCQKDIEEMKESGGRLSDIVKSCRGKIIHVNNPTLKRKNGDELELNREAREDSREILFEHLKENCQGEPYNPSNLKELSKEIADDYFQYLKKKEELQKELEEEMKRLNSRAKTSVVYQISSSQISSVNISDNQTELTTEEKPTEPKENLIIIEKEKRDKMIAELQSKKERLQKEIEEKEKVIRQKVLKHIFNNYEGIKQELGGDIFLNSVAGDHNWQEINSEFANKELIVKWLSQGFSYQQTKDWATALRDEFIPQNDAGFCSWMRDTKKLTVDKVKRRSYPCNNVERLRKEYADYLKKETELLDKHKEQLSLEESSVQKWLNEKYPKEKRKSVKRLNISRKDLEGDLDLNDFINLEKLDCSYNKFTSLDISNCSELVEVLSRDNLLTSINLPLNSKKLRVLQLGNNDFPASDLACFAKYINLNDLRLGTDDEVKIKNNVYNRFAGSLKPLKNLKKLHTLGVSNTDLDSGLEYLPESIETIYCYNLCRNEAGCQRIFSGLNDIQVWRRDNPNLIIARWKEEVEQAKEMIVVKDQKNTELENELTAEREEFAKFQEKSAEYSLKQVEEIKRLRQKVNQLEQQNQQALQIQPSYGTPGSSNPNK